MIVVPLVARGQDQLGSSLDEEMDVILVLDDHGHSLPLGAEGELDFCLVLASILFVVDSHLLEVLENGDFSGRTLFLRLEQGRTVDQGSNLEQLHIPLVRRQFAFFISLFIDVNDLGLNVPNLTQSHLVHGQSSRLVRTNVVSSTHRLASLHFPHQVLVQQHLLH